jgi:hypothetical protein
MLEAQVLHALLMQFSRVCVHHSLKQHRHSRGETNAA